MAFKEQIGLGIVLDFDNRGDREIRATRKQLRAMRNEARGGMRALDSEMGDISQKIADEQKSMQNTRRAAMATGAAVLGFGTLVLREAIKAEHAHGRIRAVMQSQGKSFEEARNLVKELEEDIQRAAQIVPFDIDRMREEAFGMVSGLGIEMARAAVLPTGKMGIAGAAADFADAAKLMRTVINTFGDTAEFAGLTPAEKVNKIAEETVMAAGMYDTQLTFLTQALSNSVASQVTLSSEYAEGLAFLGSLMTKGLPAERAGTALNMMMMQLGMANQKLEKFRKDNKGKNITVDQLLGLDFSKVEAETAADKYMRKFAQISFSDEQGKPRALTNILKEYAAILGITPQVASEMQAAMQEGVDPTKVPANFGLDFAAIEALGQLWGTEAGRGFMMAIPSIFNIEEDIEKIQAGGKLEEMFAAASDTTQSELTILSNNLKTVAIVIGDGLLPPLRSLIESINDLLEWAQENKETTSWVGGGLLGLGTLGTGILGGKAIAHWFRGQKLRKIQLAKETAKAIGETTDDVARGAARKFPSLARSMAEEAAKGGGWKAGAKSAGKWAGRAMRVGWKTTGVGAAVDVILDPAQIVTTSEESQLLGMADRALTKKEYESLGFMPSMEAYWKTLLANAPDILDYVYGGPRAEPPWITDVSTPETWESFPVAPTINQTFGDIHIDARGSDGDEILDTLTKRTSDSATRDKKEKF